MREDVFAGAMGGLCFILVVALAIGLAIMVPFLLTLKKALSRVSPRNRQMEPGMVWLMLIPCVNIVWQFVVAVKVPDSLRNEFRDRGQDDGSDYGKGIALAQAVLGLVGGVVSNVASRAQPDVRGLGTCVSGVLGLVGLVLFILFWVKVSNYSNQLALGGGPPPGWKRALDIDDDYGPGKHGPDLPPDSYKEQDPGRYQ
jgi:hypothetical protein